MRKSRLSFWQIWNMCFGFLGIQIGFELQNSNTSRIFQTLGADVDALPILWVAAPLTGLIIQPIIGYMSDKTWTPLGRRRPYFLTGAILASLALVAMPNSGFLWMAAGLLWIKDASLNITMEPFRAFVGDNLPDEQRPTGYAMQSFFIGLGAVTAAALPYVLTNYFGVSNVAPEGKIPATVHLAYYMGAFCLFAAVIWTVISSKEYPPEQLEAYEKARKELLGEDVLARPDAPVTSGPYFRNGMIWLVAGALVSVFVWGARLDPRPDVLSFLGEIVFQQQLYVLGGMIIAYGLIQILAGAMLSGKGGAAEGDRNGFVEIVVDLYRMPTTMRQLAVVQFFSWFAMFAMWIYGTPAIAEQYFNSIDPATKAYQDGADWWGLMGSVRNGTAAVAALAIIWLSHRMDNRHLHALNLFIGAVGFGIVYLGDNPALLWVPMVCVGIAWASIVSVPYAILSGAVPAEKMGVYMGIFNIFIVFPQLIAAFLLSFLLNAFFGGASIFSFVLAAGSFALAGLASFFVRDVVSERRGRLQQEG